MKRKTSKCEDCVVRKAKQKSVSKASGNKSTGVGVCMLLGTISIKAVGVGGARFWIILGVDETSDMR